MGEICGNWLISEDQIKNYQQEWGQYPSVIGGQEYHLDHTKLTIYSHRENPEQDFHKTHILINPVFPSTYLEDHASLIIPEYFIFLFLLISIAMITWRTELKKWPSKKILFAIVSCQTVVFCTIVFLIGTSYEPDRWTLQIPEEWKGKYLGYYYAMHDGSDFILQGVGLDRDRDLLDPNHILENHESSQERTRVLSIYKYDPTNGTESSGDLFYYIDRD